MKKILFLRTHDVKLDEHVAHPLGSLYLSAKVRDTRPGRFESRIVHTGLLGDVEKEYGRILQEFSPDYVVATTFTPEISFLNYLIRLTKKHAGTCRVLVGGPYPSSMPEHAAAQWGVDAVGVGEGEETLIDLLDAFEQDRPLDQVKGIAFRKNDPGKPDGDMGGGGEVISTEPRPLIQDLNTLPMPAWDLIDPGPYGKVVNMSNSLKGRNYASLFTSRGCPYNCVYCHSIQGRRFRARSPELVLREIRWLYDEMDIDEFHIMDDIFNFDRERMHAICRKIIDSGMKVHISFPNGIRTDLLTEGDVDILESAGVYKVWFAIETRSERLQKEINKRNDFDKIDPIIRYTSRSSIIANSFFMIGFPTETVEEMAETINYAVKSDLDAAAFFQVIPYPGTKLWEWAFKKNGHLADTFSFKPEQFHFSSGHSASTHLSHRELTFLVLSAYFRFFTRPSRLIRLFRKTSNKKEFLRTYYKTFKEYVKFCLKMPISEHWKIAAKIRRCK